MLNWIKSLKIWTIVAGLFIVLLGMLSFSNSRAKKKQDEIDDLEKQIEMQQYNYEIKEFHAVNATQKDNTDETINKDDNSDILPDTTYEL
jgi:hypothetical protein